MRRFNLAVLAALTLSTGLTAGPAQADGGQRPLGLDNCTATACHFDVPPGTYDVTVRLGGATGSSTSITGETRRSLLPETAAPAGERVTRSFTVNVRTPEGEPTGPEGTPGLDLTIGGTAPALAGIRVTPAASRAGAHPPGKTPSPDRSSSSATPRSATSPATRTPAGASNCRSTCAGASPSPTTRTPARARSVTSRTRGCGPPSSP